MRPLLKSMLTKKRLPALVLVLGISFALGLAVFTRRSGPALSRIYISLQPPGVVSFKDVMQITETEISELSFLTVEGQPAKIIYKEGAEFYIYTSHDGIHFSPLYLTRSGN